MARLILPVAGAALGSFFGPVGTQVGFALGSLASALLFPVKQTDPKPLDTKWTGLEYGTPIPWFIGQMRLSAIPVYLSEKSYVAQTTEAGKGGDEVTTGYEYYADVLFLISDNESAALLDVIKAGRRAWTARSDATTAQLEASVLGEDWEEIRFYGGADDQLPDPDYEADKGVGFAPAYIGRTSVFIKRLRLDSGAQLPQLHFVPATDADPADTDEVVLFRFDGDSSEVGGRTVSVAGSPDFAADIAVFGTSGRFAAEEVVTVPTNARPAAKPVTLECWFRQTSNLTSTDINPFVELAPVGGGRYLRLGWRSGFQFISDVGEGIVYDISDDDAPIDTWVFVRACFDPADGQMWLFVDGHLVANDVVPALIGGAADEAHQVLVGQKTAPNIEGGILFVDDARVTIGRIRSTADFSVPTAPLPYDPLATVTPNELDLADVVTALHARAGHDASLLDVSDLAGTEVHGVIAGQVQPVRGVLQQLAQGYYFERVASGGVMKYVDRGGASVITIPFGDLGVGEDGAEAEPLKMERGNDLEVPNDWTVEFVSRRGRRYETGAAHSSRVATEAAGSQKVSLGIAFREAQGRGRAQSFALDAAVARTTFEFSVGLEYAYLEPTDVVTVTARSGSTFRVRILEVSEARGILQCKAVLDDPYALRAEGAAPGDDEAVQDIALPADTTMVLLDIAPLRDSEAQTAGHMVAATGSGGGTWPGASIRRSIDGADFTEQAALVLERAVIGTTTTVLDAAPPLHREHRAGTLSVSVLGTLGSSTRAAMQQDRTINVLAVETAVGEWEVLRFRTATLTGTLGDYNLYTLTGLQRGRRGTEALVADHATGTRVVLLRTAGLRNVAAELADVGLERSFRGVTLGRALGTAGTVAFTNRCRRFKAWAPASLRVARDGSDNATITLRPRTRLLGRYGGSGGSVLTASDADSFEVDVYADDTYAAVVRTLGGVQAGIDYSAAQQTSDGLTPGDPLHLRAYHVSTTVGRGYALEAAA